MVKFLRTPPSRTQYAPLPFSILIIPTPSKIEDSFVSQIPQPNLQTSQKLIRTRYNSDLRSKKICFNPIAVMSHNLLHSLAPSPHSP